MRRYTHEFDIITIFAVFKRSIVAINVCNSLYKNFLLYAKTCILSKEQRPYAHYNRFKQRNSVVNARG